MLTISVWPRRLKEFLLTHPLYKSPLYSPARPGDLQQEAAGELEHADGLGG